MRKPVPEDFGLTSQEYASLAAERTRLREAIDIQPSSVCWVEALIGGAIVAFILGFFGGAAGLGVAFVLDKVFGEQSGRTFGLPFMIGGAIIGASYGLISILTEPYREQRKLTRYRKQLSDPQYHKVALYEEAIRRYEYRQERYWKSLKGAEFERALARLYTDMGYSVHQTKGSGDEGIDLILRKDNKEIIVQCKGHEKPIGVGAVRDLYGVMMHSGAEGAVLACPVGFTDGVRKFANGKPIDLLAAKEIVEMAESVHNDKKKE
jgi:hypothetical protein